MAVARAFGAAPALRTVPGIPPRHRNRPHRSGHSRAQTLTLTDTVNGHTQTATSNATGVYYMNALPADNFKLVVSANGFASKTLTERHDHS